jgi:hypothetical protein
MTSFRQMEANRRNASKSTGPKTEAGKQITRRNAIRHGLTAETVIGALEDSEDYQEFEAAITADYDAQSAVERELVLRLASLFWRLRRATAIETGLFEIQASQVPDPVATRQDQCTIQDILRATFMPASGAPLQLPHCYLRLLELSNDVLQRLSRYEATLWRQVGQTLFALDSLDRRKPQERNRRIRVHCAE